MNVFFVCGAPKSGTTWVQRMLDAHPEISCAGEGHFIEHFSGPFSTVLRNYNQQMAARARGVYEGKPDYGPVDQAMFDDMVRGFIMARMTCRGCGPQVRWVGDKTPRYTSSLPRLQRLFPEAKFLNIIRDPRDVVLSRLFILYRDGKTQYAEDLAAPQTVDLIGRMGVDWSESIRPVQAFAEANPGRLLSLSYEAMLQDPAAEARKAYAFLGASTDDGLIAEVVRTTSFEAQAGRPPGEEAPGRYFRKGVAGDWQGRLGPAALAALDQACGDLMRELGYV